MLKFLKHISREGFKKDIRKLGVNLITAAAIGMFINRAVDLSTLASALLFIALLFGIAFMIVGLYKGETDNDD